MSETVLAIGPAVFMFCQSRGLGTSGIIQVVGRWPTMLHHPAGCRMDPPMSEPSASAQRPAASAAPLPPLLAPGHSSGSQGLRVEPNTGLLQVSLAIVNSGVLSLPRMIAPAAFSRSTTRWSKSGTWSRSARQAIVVLTPLVWKQSFTPTGRPCRTPLASFRERARSAAFASSRASSRRRVTKAFSTGLMRSIRAICASTSSSTPTAPPSSRRFCSTAD